MSGVRSKANANGKYAGWYYDANGAQRFFVGTDSKTETRDMARELENKHRPARLGLEPDYEERLATPIADAIHQYTTWGKVAGGRRGRPWSDTHTRMRGTHLKYWVEKLHLCEIGDLVGSQVEVESAIAELREKGLSGNPLAGKTISNYVEAIASFCDFLVKRKMIPADPLKHLSRIDSTPQVQRRAMTPEEIRALLKSCAPNRRLCYEVAFSSGLRKGELSHLQVRDLDTQRCGLRLRAAWTKNRKDGFQPLPTDLAARLAEASEGKAPTDPLLYVASHTARDLDKDLDQAGIDPEDNGEGKIDFHACRTAYATLVVEAGANLKEAQDLARHHDPKLTMNVYARSRSDRRQELAETVGTLLSGHATSKSASSTTQWRRRESNPQSVQKQNDARAGQVLPILGQTSCKSKQFQAFDERPQALASHPIQIVSAHNKSVLLHGQHVIGMHGQTPTGRAAGTAGDGPLVGAHPRQIRQIKLRAKRAAEELARLSEKSSRTRVARVLRDLVNVIAEVIS